MPSFQFPPPPPPPPTAFSTQNTQTQNQRGGHRGRGIRDRGGGGVRGRGSNNRGTRGDYSQRDNPPHGNAQTPPQPSHRNDGTHWNPQGHSEAPGLSQVNTIHTGKRRRESSQSSTTQVAPSQNPQPPKPKPPKAKAIAAPAVPGFGFTLPVPSKPIAPSLPSAPKTKKTKPVPKGKFDLGLTPRHPSGETESSEDEDADIDEEAVLGQNFKGLVFMYQDEELSLQTPAELAAFIKERKRRYPTKKRIQEKAEEAMAKRERELGFLKMVKAREAQSKGLPVPASPVRQKPNLAMQDSSISKPPDTPTQQNQLTLEELRKRALESATHTKQSPAAPVKSVTQKQTGGIRPINLGLNYYTESDESDAEGSDMDLSDESSVLSPSEPSSSDSESETEEEREEPAEEAESDDSDEAPEQISSKIVQPEVEAPPRPKVVEASPKLVRETRECLSWQHHGTCKYGDKCKFRHPKKEGKKQRPTLYEVWVEQELGKADALALQAIKYLGDNGFLG